MKRSGTASGRFGLSSSLRTRHDIDGNGPQPGDALPELRRDRRRRARIGIHCAHRTLVKWFPDKRGMITGLAVAGFGAGALVTAPLANSLIASVGVGRTFEILGLGYLVVVFACALLMRNPAAGYAPAGFRAATSQSGKATRDFTLRQALGSWQWYALWLTLFLNTTAGIAIISQASPMAQEISGVSAATAAGMVGLISIANGSGRFLWAWFSDAVGRRTVFLVMFLLQSVTFLLLSQVHEFALLSALAFVILLCYGGGFGTMPAFATDYFGAGQIGSIYGLMLTAWDPLRCSAPVWLPDSSGDGTLSGRDALAVTGVAGEHGGPTAAASAAGTAVARCCGGRDAQCSPAADVGWVAN
ncbi:MAG: OFA family MFS transporter [Ignavibacteriota bacterium]